MGSGEADATVREKIRRLDPVDCGVQQVAELVESIACSQGGVRSTASSRSGPSYFVDLAERSFAINSPFSW